MLLGLMEQRGEGGVINIALLLKNDWTEMALANVWPVQISDIALLSRANSLASAGQLKYMGAETLDDWRDGFRAAAS